MARISTYGKDNTLNNKDKVLGSSYVRTVGNVDEFETKNFTLEELNGFFAAEGSALSISLNSKYYVGNAEIELNKMKIKLNNKKARQKIAINLF